MTSTHRHETWERSRGRPFLQVAFGTASLDPTQWATCLAMASLVLWLQELVKLVRRVGARRRNQARAV